MRVKWIIFALIVLGIFLAGCGEEEKPVEMPKGTHEKPTSIPRETYLSDLNVRITYYTKMLDEEDAAVTLNFENVGDKPARFILTRVKVREETGRECVGMDESTYKEMNIAVNPNAYVMPPTDQIKVYFDMKLPPKGEDTAQVFIMKCPQKGTLIVDVDYIKPGDKNYRTAEAELNFVLL